jgi:uncharacterized protein
MTRPSERLLVFARVPEHGRVKTRLARDLGDDVTLELYTAMLEDLLESVGGSDAQREVEILWTAENDVRGTVLSQWFGDRELAMQTGANLGDRLVTAFAERILFHCATKVIAIGTDDPTLSRGEIDIAFDLLDSCEWVVGPATDGGYYLIGCRGDAFFTRAFDGIAWGTPEVFAETMQRIRTRKRTVAVLPRRTDIDVAADLTAFRESPQRELARRLDAVVRREFES